MNSFTSGPAAIAAGVLVLGFVLYRQMQASPLRLSRLTGMPALLLYGAVQLSPALAGLDAAALALAAGGALVGAALGVGRALSVRVWRATDGTPWSQGTSATLALWALLVGVRVILGVGDRYVGISSRALDAEMLWAAFATFAAQNLATWLRAAGSVDLAAQRD